MILIIVIFNAVHFLCTVEYEFVLLKAGHTFFLLCRVKLAKVCHMYRFCVCIREGGRKGKTRCYCCYVKQKYVRVAISTANLVQQAL